MEISQDFGLVFSGGGGKGAYQIGVWKALNELRFTPKIKAVSGSSVGSLNALLFCQKNFELALHTWENIEQWDMLYSEDSSKKYLIDAELSCFFNDCNLGKSSSKIKPLISLSVLAPAFIPLFSLLSPLIKFFCKDCDFDVQALKKLVELVQYSIGKEGFFSQQKLGEIIDNILFLSNNSKKITAFATVCKDDIYGFLKKIDVEYINLINKTPAQTREILLASSALPLIYPNRKIDNYEYYDGGWVDNTPIKPIFDMGIKNIIVVYLENNKHNKLKKTFRDEDENFPNINLIRVIPNNDFKDDFMQTLSVSPELTKQRIEMGYSDGIQQLGKYYT